MNIGKYRVGMRINDNELRPMNTPSWFSATYMYANVRLICVDAELRKITASIFWAVLEKYFVELAILCSVSQLSRPPSILSGGRRRPNGVVERDQITL